MGQLGSFGGSSLEAFSLPLSIIAGASAVPLMSSLVNLKFTEKLAFVNIDYGENIQAFLDVLTSYTRSKETVDFIQGKPNSKGKLTSTLPSFSIAGVVKLYIFLVLFSLRIPLKIFFWLLKKRWIILNGALFKVFEYYVHFSRIMEFTFYNSFLLDNSF